MNLHFACFCSNILSGGQGVVAADAYTGHKLCCPKCWRSQVDEKERKEEIWQISPLISSVQYLLVVIIARLSIVLHPWCQMFISVNLEGISYSLWLWSGLTQVKWRFCPMSSLCLHWMSPKFLNRLCLVAHGPFFYNIFSFHSTFQLRYSIPWIDSFLSICFVCGLPSFWRFSVAVGWKTVKSNIQNLFFMLYCNFLEKEY